MKRQNRLVGRQEQDQQQEQGAQHASGEELVQESVREFQSAEQLLRHDALHTPVPPRVAERLQASTATLPPPPRRPWWRRIID